MNLLLGLEETEGKEGSEVLTTEVAEVAERHTKCSLLPRLPPRWIPTEGTEGSEVLTTEVAQVAERHTKCSLLPQLPLW